MIVIDNEFEIGELVYLKTDDDQKIRLVTAIKVCPDDSYLYELVCGALQSFHYDFEITREKDVLKAVI